MTKKNLFAVNIDDKTQASVDRLQKRIRRNEADTKRIIITNGIRALDLMLGENPNELGGQGDLKMQCMIDEMTESTRMMFLDKLLATMPKGYVEKTLSSPDNRNRLNYQDGPKNERPDALKQHPKVITTSEGRKLFECEQCIRTGFRDQFITFKKVGEDPVTGKIIWKFLNGDGSEHMHKEAGGAQQSEKANCQSAD
jgi:hypothetical protein